MRPRVTRLAAVLAAVLAGGLLAASCSSAAKNAGTTSQRAGTIAAIGAENQYADVIGQVGGQYVTVNAVMSNPATDPHTFEASQAVAQQVGAARLVVQNGLGYDSFMSTIESAAPNQGRTVIDVQRLLGLPDSTPNPHLWYQPAAMPKVAAAIAGGLSRIQPEHKAYFMANLAKFNREVAIWTATIAEFKASYPAVKVATTEPVADDMLQAAGAVNMTPWAFQADVMNGVDPAPQDITAERALFTERKVQALLYNQQVTDPLTESLITLARDNHIPVVGVYETMPTPGYNYQSWMTAEVQALHKAVADKISTVHL